MEVIKIIKDNSLVEGKRTLTITPDTDPRSIVHVNPIKLVEYKMVNLGGWYVDIELRLEDKDHLDQDYIVLIDTKSKGEQPFRMHNKEVGKRSVKIRARHVLFDTELYVVEPFSVENSSSAGVLERINKNLDRRSPYKFISTHTNPVTKEFEAMSLFEALAYLVNDKGAKLEADWYTIYLRDDLGEDRGITVSYGKDLEDIRGFEEWDHVVTKLYPIGDDGLTLPEKYIESDVKYPREYTRTETFTLDMGEKGEDQEWTTEEKQDKLRKLAKSYVTKNKYPKLAYQVTSNIKEGIDLWDTVIVKHPSISYNLPLEGEITADMKDKLGIPIKVLSYEYDVLTKRTLKLEYGDFSVRTGTLFGDKLKDIQKEIEKTAGTFEERLKEQTDLINNWNKKGHMVILENEILFLDKLPMENAQNVLKIGLGGIAFSDRGVNGTFTSAWDLKGNFNTDFIGAGQIRTNHLASDVGSSLDISSNKTVNIIAEEAKSDLEEAKKELDGKIDGISVGGRNIVLDSGVIKKGTDYRIAGYDMSEDWKVGEYYIVTIWGSINSGQKFGIWGNGSMSRLAVLDEIKPGVFQSKFKLKTYPELTGVNSGRKKVNVYNYPSEGATSARIDAIKIEKGTKPTEWTPAPEDKADSDKIISYINVSPESIKINSGKIKLEGYTTINGKFKVDTRGNMIATGGSIASWNIDSNIWSKNGTNYTTLKSGGAVAFASGSPSPSDTSGSKFQIYHDGRMVAREADIRGKITSASGSIGGFDIGKSRLTSGSGNTFIRIDSDPSPTANVAIMVGSEDAGKAPYYVSKTGYTIMRRGEIGGWSITGEDIISREGGRYYSILRGGKADGLLWSGNVSADKAGVYISKAGAAYFKSLRPSGGASTLDIIGDTKMLGNINTNLGGGYRIGGATNRFRIIYLTNQPNVSSDIRIKSNIQEIPSELLNSLAELEARQYVQEGKVHYGYIAQDVERVLYKYCVERYGWENAQKAMERYAFLYKSESYLSLLYGELAVLKDAQREAEIKELREEVEELKRIIKEIK